MKNFHFQTGRRREFAFPKDIKLRKYLKIISIKISFLFVCVLPFNGSALADNKAAEEIEIRAVNKQVREIEKIKSELATVTVEVDVGEREGVPPVLVYYYDQHRKELVMLRSEAGHEMFLTRYTYYFNQGHIIKYLKETVSHLEMPPKQAIIYNSHGGVLWKNTDSPVVSVTDVLKIFKLNLNALEAFNQY